MFVIPLSEKPKLDLLWEKFGIAEEKTRRSEGGEPNDGEEAETRTATVDVGDIGEVGDVPMGV